MMWRFLFCDCFVIMASVVYAVNRVKEPQMRKWVRSIASHISVVACVPMQKETGMYSNAVNRWLSVAWCENAQTHPSILICVSCFRNVYVCTVHIRLIECITRVNFCKRVCAVALVVIVPIVHWAEIGPNSENERKNQLISLW